jgi:DNA invertase Pin-like site-specific DNA recombinase
MNNPRPRKVAVWIRVSTNKQSTQNQYADLMEWIEFRGWELTKIYDLTGVSARHNAHAKILKQAQTDARANQFNTLVVWALDRLDRGGAEALLRIVRDFMEVGCDVISKTESWTETSNPQVKELLLSVAGWGAGLESQRISERTIEGLKEAAKKGRFPGRPRKIKT